jgi:hypothetical protein
VYTAQPYPVGDTGADAEEVIYNPTQPAAGQSDLNAHPFFDPNADYGTNPGQQQALQPGSAVFNTWATEESPEGYYYALMNEQGFGGLDAKSQAAQGLYRDYARGYQAAKTKNQELWFPQYMQMQDPRQQIALMSNEQLGIDETRYAGRDRWSMRGY